MDINTAVIIFIVSLAGLANLFLASYVYKKNPGSKVNKSFFYFGFTIFLWILTNIIDLVANNLFTFKLTFSAGFMVPITGIFLGYALAGKIINKWLRWFLVILGFLFFVIILFTPFVVKNVTSFTNFGYNLVFGPLFYFWGIILTLLILTSLYVPFSFMRKTDGEKKKQLQYFLTGALIFAFWGILVSVILPFLGFSELSKFDSSATLFLVGFTSYAIIKYNLMDISSLFFTAITYSAVIISIIAFLLLLLFISSFFFSHLTVWPIYILVLLVSIVLFFIGRLFFMEKKDLEQTKINLTELLKKSELNRIKAEVERDKTSTIVSSFSDGLILLDEKDDIFSINPAAEKLLGLEKKEFIGKPLNSIVPSVKITKARAIMSVFGDGLKTVNRQSVKLDDNLTAEISAMILTSAGKNIGRLIILHDITREKMIEKMKTDFVSLAAHQLRTPLSIIKWSLSMLNKGDFGKLNKKQSAVLKNTFRSNERLISLVNNLLNVTRMEDGRYLYKLAKTDMREIVDAVLDGYKNEIGKRKLKLEYKKPESLPEIEIDSEKIKIVVQNLIDNAIKYSLHTGKINIILQNKNNEIKFEVKDFGSGIPKEQQGKIFQKFFRADNAVTMNAAGTGLGLFLSKNIIEAHGGKIDFVSTENSGTSFYFSLPIK